MIVYEGLQSILQPFAESTVAIGTFDGVHRGHQEIIRTAVADAHGGSRPAVVLTFDRHPAEFLAPDRAPAYLTTPGQRQALIQSLGVDILVIARFDASLASLSPDQFVGDVLKGLLGAASLVVGADFCFGRGRSGNVNYLEGAKERFHYTLQGIDPVLVDGAPASSSRARSLVLAGDIGGAEAVLGHPFWLAGRVVHGQKLGRKIGYPTANVELEFRQVAPCDGIYVVKCRLQDGRMAAGVCSIGDRPSMPGAGFAIEAHLFDLDADIYGWEIELRFVHRLRDQEKFDSVAELQQQIAHDIVMAQPYLKGGNDDGI